MEDKGQLKRDNEKANLSIQLVKTGYHIVFFLIKML